MFSSKEIAETTFTPVTAEGQAGETIKLTFKIRPEMLKFTGINMEKILEPGNYTVTLGTTTKEDITKQIKLIK